MDVFQHCRRYAPFIAAEILLLPVVLPPVVETLDDVVEKAYAAPGQMVDVGGHLLHVYCRGAGSPTVFLESGMASNWTLWEPVFAETSRNHRVCVYDRAGYGWSEPGPMPRTGQRIVDDLHALLRSRQMRETRYVLVAHSFGTYPARMIASEDPSLISALVLVEPANEDEDEQGLFWDARGWVKNVPDPARPRTARNDFFHLPGTRPLGTFHLRQLLKGRFGMPREVRSMPDEFQNRWTLGTPVRQRLAEESEDEMKSDFAKMMHSHPLPPDVRLRVIVGRYAESPRGFHDPQDPKLLATTKPPEFMARREMLAHSVANGRLIEAVHSGHFAHVDEPGVVIGVLKEILETNRPVFSGHLQQRDRAQ
jgi:pimeloyl-ACP methyl ester carboxylesterase